MSSHVSLMNTRANHATAPKRAERAECAERSVDSLRVAPLTRCAVSASLSTQSVTAATLTAGGQQ
jgi:hypothetical protein